MRVSREWASRASALCALTTAGTLGLSGVAFADNINDNIEGSAVLSFTAGSTTGQTASIKVVSTNGNDGDSGCNLDGGAEKLVLSFIAPTGVTVDGNPATPALDLLTMTACDVDYSVLVKAGAGAVSGTITAAIDTDTSGSGSYNNNVRIPVTIAAPANTAPRVSVTGVTDGSTYAKSAVPQPGCSVVDDEDSGESATPSITNGLFDALGSHTVTCSYTDDGKLSRSASATYTVVRDRDTTAPVVGYRLTPAQPDGDNGWYRGDVSLAWSVTEGESPETLTKAGCEDQSVTADQAATAYSCSATSEGGAAPEQSVSIKRDGTGPVVSYDGVTGTAGDNGWYTSPVTATFTGTDALSGPATARKTVTSAQDGAAVTLESPAFSDAAGNTTAAGAATSPAFKVDTQAPNAPTASLSSPANGLGWHNGDVTVHFTSAGDNGPSGVGSCTSDVIVNVETAGRSVSGTCTDEAGNESEATVVSVKLDKSEPTVSQDVTVKGTAGINGWYTSDVDVTFTANDDLSGLAAASKTVTSSGEGAAVGVRAEFTDRAGNSATATRSFKVDKTAPATPTFVGGSSAKVYFGDVQTPTCESSDATSGLEDCVVTGGGTGLGDHTWTATATDNAGNTSTATQSYTVLPWNLKGFYSPVDMGGVWNSAKAGSTIPLKFELFAGTRELTDVAGIKSFKYAGVSCTTGAATADEIEMVTSGATSLRYDAVGGQFIQNWKTPAAGCYKATLTAVDGSTTSAMFNLRK